MSGPADPLPLRGKLDTETLVVITVTASCFDITWKV